MIDIRTSLLDNAEFAPDDAQLLTIVRAKSKRYAVRRRALMTAAVAVVAAAIVLPVAGLGSGQGHLRVEPGASAPASAPPLKPITLVQGDLPVPRFPLSLRPGSLPKGLVLDRSPDLESNIFVLSAHSRSPSEGDNYIEIDVYGERACSDAVHGTPVRLASGAQAQALYNGRFLTWRRRSDQCVVVQVGRDVRDPLTAAERVANGLIDRPMAVRRYFTFGLHPEGYAVDWSAGPMTAFLPSPQARLREMGREELVPRGGIEVELATTGIYSFEYHQPVTQIHVNGHKAQIGSHGALRLLEIQIAKDRWLNIAAPASAISDAELVRFASAVQVRPGAAVARG